MYHFTVQIFIMAVLLANRLVTGRLRSCPKVSHSLDQLRIGVSQPKYFTNYLAFQAVHSTRQVRRGRRNAFHHQLQPQIRYQTSFFSSITQDEATTQKNLTNTTEFFANIANYPDFASLGISSSTLLQRLISPPLNLARPSSVQAASYDAIARGDNVILGAETGTGKTLAYLLPLVEDILKRKKEWKMRQSAGEVDSPIMDPGYQYARAIILVPNKELAHQAVRMAASICGGLRHCVIWGSEGVMAGTNLNLYDEKLDENTAPEEEIVRLALLPGGLATPYDYPPFRFAQGTKTSSLGKQPPPDLVFATPASLGPMALSPKNIELFSDVETLVIDEADMLLDGGYVRQLNNVLMGFRRADRVVSRNDASFFRKKRSDVEEKDILHDGCDVDLEEEKPKTTQHIFVAATLPDYGLRSVDAYLKKKFPDALKITMAGMHNARHYGLEQDSQTIWNEIDENQERMKRLVDVLRLDRSEVGLDGRGMKEEKVMVFLNTVNDVDGATNGLRRAGINAVPYHAQVPLEERAANLDKFRRYRAPSNNNDSDENNEETVPVLVCTDLASRGLDIPGVTAVVQLQFATNVVIHLHRMGRCGRAGNSDGRGIIFYGANEKELVEVVKEAEYHQSSMTLIQDVEDELDNEEGGDCEQPSDKSKVKKAFSRKRGFTKKRKKEKKEAKDAATGQN